jgi:tellurite resistance protein
MMNSVAYPEDSRAAILRIAILVAYSDSSWHDLERARLENIYRNICVMLDEDLDDDALLRELDEITTDVPTEIEALADDDDIDAYWEDCLSSIVSEDIQQLAVAASLALAVGDSEIDAGELSGIARLCEEWDVALSDAEEIWND